MAKKFVRNITDTKCKGRNQEPLETNRQNDILSDEHDVYVRNKDYYHCLTNAIQKIESKNDSIIVSKKDKNTVELEYVGGDGGGGTPGTSIPTEIISKSKYIDVKEVGTNKFELLTEQLEIELEEIRELIEEMGNGDDGFLGNVPGYDFEDIIDNDEHKYETLNWTSSGNTNLSGDNNTGYFEITLRNDYPKKDLLLNRLILSNVNTATRRNLFIEISNRTERPVQLLFNETIFDGGMPFYENGKAYNGEIVLEEDYLSTIKMTVYTNNEGKIIKTFLKKM